MLWPAATQVFSKRGERSMIGRLSQVIGRQPHHSSSTSPFTGSRK